MRVTLILVQIFFISIVASKRFTVKTNRTWSSRGLHRPRQNDDKIAGGWYARSMKKYSYMVSIMMYKSHQCGGCLLSLNFVVTACHCLADVPAEAYGPAKPLSYLKLSAFSFIAGTINIKEYDKHVQIGKAKSLHFHPKCQNKRSLIYDHGVAILSKPFHETPYVKPVKLYTWESREFRKLFLEMFSKEEQPTCVVAGWGDTRRGTAVPGRPSTRLKAVQMFVLSEEDCSEAWNELVNWQFQGFNFWKYGEICVISKNQDESDCSGDSGSPYVCEGHLVATVSYGTEDCALGAPSVYATMAELLNWITKDFPKEVNIMKPRKSPIPVPQAPTESPVPEHSKEQVENVPSKEARTIPTTNNSNQESSSQDATPILIVLLMKVALEDYS